MPYAFETFILDDERRELRKDSGTPIALEPQVFDLLCFLVRHRDRVVSKSEIVETIWDGRAVQDEITTRIAAAIEPELDNSEQRRAAAATRKADAAAYDLVQRENWHHNKFTAANWAEAQRLFESAIEIDPQYSRAYASMALSKFWASQMGWAENWHCAMESALKYSRKAIALDDEDARGFFHPTAGAFRIDERIHVERLDEGLVKGGWME